MCVVHNGDGAVAETGIVLIGRPGRVWLLVSFSVALSITPIADHDINRPIFHHITIVNRM